MRQTISTSHANIESPAHVFGHTFSGDGLPLADPSRSGPINILVVDDEPKNITVLETVLQHPDYQLIKTNSADQALLALLMHEFAVLIIDVRMPDVTGIELARMIKERKKTSQIPIIFLTAYYNEDQHILEGYGTGAVDYLQKPVKPDILRTKVAVFAELYRMQREINAANRLLSAEVAERFQVQEQLRELNATLEQRVLERTHALRTSAALLQAATDNASVGLGTFDPELRCTYSNPAFSRIFARPGFMGPPNKLLAADDAKRICPVLRDALAGRRATCELTRPGEERARPSRHYSVVCEPERDADGNIVGVVMVVFDNTDRKRSEEHIQMLLREVNHRSKNTLSVVSAIARQTKAPTMEEFVSRFSDRVHALAASHDLLANSEWRSIAITDLMRSQLGHFRGCIGRRISLLGPSLSLSVAASQCIGMVVHELATNAAKYGALSNQVGSVNVEWALDAQSGLFAMSWIERGGPPVAAPAHRGYGSTVILGMVELGLEGQVWLEYARTGFSWRLQCPKSRILEATDINAADALPILPLSFEGKND